MEHSMPRTVTHEPVITTETSSRVKLYVDDHKQAIEIQEEAQGLFRQLTIQEILREAIHIGLPLVAKRYRAAIKAAIDANPIPAT